jgi:uncharacterized membrane protein
LAPYLAALLIGIVAGLRALTAPAAVSWGAYLGRLSLQGSWLGFLSSIIAAAILTILAVVELVTDQLPSTPSRKVPLQLGARLVLGAASGAAIGASDSQWIGDLIAGVIGAIIGTYGGAAARSGLARAVGSDRPAALVEDAVAIIGAILIVGCLA